jgi:hypothetical protein
MKKLLGAAVVLTFVLSATDVVALRVAVPLQRLVADASVVAVGTVQSVRTLRTGPSGSVYSVADLEPEAWLKGGPEAGPIQILTPGGVLPEEGIGVWVSEQAQFRPGERVLVALEPSPLEDGRYMPVNRVQGKVRLDVRVRPYAGETALAFFERVAPGTASAALPSAAALPFDFLSVATHEEGHFTGLGDLYNNASQGSGTNGYLDCMGTNNQAKTMYGLITAGAISDRDLHPADVLGEQWVYGSLQLPIPNGAENENLFDYFCANADPVVTCSSATCTRKIHWTSLPVPFAIHTADFLPEHVQLIQQGFNTWHAAPRSSFAVRYTGDTSVDVVSQNDGVNVVRVANPDNSDDRAALGAGALAVTQFAWFVNSGNTANADITFNGQVDFDPALPPVQSEPTPSPTPKDSGGGCGTVDRAPPSGPSALGALLLLAVVAALTRRHRPRAQVHPLLRR